MSTEAQKGSAAQTVEGGSLLEEILAERLELLRSGEIGPAHLHRANKSKSKSA